MFLQVEIVTASGFTPEGNICMKKNYCEYRLEYHTANEIKFVKVGI